ncbi:3-deoxy-manno-octulosonate cytidylyltransferase (CMP-KDO synthetase) [Selenomonas ruminantium]|uniref:3-deoxy-manno-octulosonate cytidylyltransferase (CMP-KDO synthetase) n=2 Tax=Selenomonas ruminantium TaxID=971 RepID=A0A1H0S0F2_SELRU|nr:3-deoxy-manno-octulosonate cytidylyltransferase (CMP-KDO synthetase) [Selenomonas ruminantium]
MIWWVYQQAAKVKELEQVFVATDDERIQEVCEAFDIACIMTRKDHITHVSRIHEVSEKVSADYYVVVCGDEPLIEADVIRKIFDVIDEKEEYCVGGLCRYFTDPAEVVDPANIKVATNKEEDTIMLTRSPVPFPYKTIMFRYKKLIGVECYNKASLDYFVSQPKGAIESIEDVTLQRFLEHHIKVKHKLVETDALSVDTPRDLEKVREIMAKHVTAVNKVSRCARGGHSNLNQWTRIGGSLLIQQKSTEFVESSLFSTREMVA